MTTFRRHLRLWVIVWLVFQAASLSALVPRDCCAAHRPAADKTERTCHESAPATLCPMRSADGTPCPMHRDRGGHRDHHQSSQSSTSDCSLRGTCDGPMAAFFTQLSNHGVLPESFSAIPNVEVSSLSTPARESVVSRLESPDPPPPRA